VAPFAPGDLSVLPGHEGGVAELAEEDRVVKRAEQFPVAPEPLEVPQDLGQVAVADEPDRDVVHRCAAIVIASGGAA
jgi:hypothetical protein